MPSVPILQVPKPQKYPTPQTKEQFIRFIDNPEIPERKRYEAMRHFMLSTLDFDPVAKEVQHKTYRRRNRPVPTPPFGTARYEDRLHNAKSTLTHDDYAHPLSAIAALLKDQVVLEIEKDILITERESTRTKNLRPFEKARYENEISELNASGRQVEANLNSMQGELSHVKLNVEYLVGARETDRRQFQREARQLIAAKDMMRQKLGEAQQALVVKSQELERTKAALGRIAKSLKFTVQTLTERVNESSFLKTEIKNYLSSRP